jgi:hypothetical protein
MQGYIVSSTDLRVKDVVVPAGYEINEDTAAAAVSNITLSKGADTRTGDYVCLRGNGDTVYLGIISGIEGDKQTSQTVLHALPVSSIFAQNILLGEVQPSTESFVQSAILDNFVNSGDPYFDIPYLDVSARTQTAPCILPDSQNGIYNLDAFIRYIAKQHDIYTDFALTTESLNVTIEKRSPPVHVVDATVADVLSLTETVTSECVSKVAVKTQTGVLTYYLFNEGSFGKDPAAGVRVPGRMETLYCENPDDAEKTAGDVFIKNKYDHLIEAEILAGSLLYDIFNMNLYDRAIVKTGTGIYETYISSRSRKSTAKTVLFKFGDARVTLTDKLRR